MTKKRDARAKLLFCQSNPIVFLPFLLPSPSSLLKLSVISQGNQWWRLEMSVLVFSQATMQSNGCAVLRNVVSAMAS